MSSLKPGEAWPLASVYKALHELEATILITGPSSVSVQFPPCVSQETRGKLIPHLAHWREQLIKDGSPQVELPKEILDPAPAEYRRAMTLEIMRAVAAEKGTRLVFQLPNGSIIQEGDKACKPFRRKVTAGKGGRVVAIAIERLAVFACVPGVPGKPPSPWVRLPKVTSAYEDRVISGEVSAKAKSKKRDRG